MQIMPGEKDFAIPPGWAKADEGKSFIHHGDCLARCDHPLPMIDEVSSLTHDDISTSKISLE